MSGAFPISSAKFGTLGIKSIQNTIISKTLSGKKLCRQIDNQRFAFTIQIINYSSISKLILPYPNTVLLLRPDMNRNNRCA